jgi:hypothetical protein
MTDQAKRGRRTVVEVDPEVDAVATKAAKGKVFKKQLISEAVVRGLDQMGVKVPKSVRRKYLQLAA